MPDDKEIECEIVSGKICVSQAARAVAPCPRLYPSLTGKG